MMEDIVIWLLAAVIPLIVLIAFAGFIAVCGVVLAEAKVCLGQFWRELRRRPQFGIVSIFSLTAMFALASALLGQFELQPGFSTLVVAVLALFWAIGVVCAVQFLVGDIAALFRPRGAQNTKMTTDPWESPDGSGPQHSTPDFSWLSRGDSTAPVASAGVDPPEIKVRK